MVFLIIAINKKSNAQLYSLTSLNFYVYFNSDSYVVEQDQKLRIRDKLLEIGSTNIKEIYVEGHTDSFASSGYNTILAENRAQATFCYLTSLGVPDRFIKKESFGESQLISREHRNNRRAKIFIVYETDYKSTLLPPKFIVIKTIDIKTKKPIKTQLGFDYKDLPMKFSSTASSGWSSAFSLESSDLNLTVSATNYLSEYFKLPPEDVDLPKDTLHYTIELKPVAITGKFTFNSIFFYTDSDEIKPESTIELHKLLAILQRNNNSYIEIQGHMNYPTNRPRNSIQDRYNRELSFKRARAVNNYLVKSGVSQKRLTYKGMSNFRMKFPLPASKAQEDQNKRVEIYTLKEN